MGPPILGQHSQIAGIDFEPLISRKRRTVPQLFVDPISQGSRRTVAVQPDPPILVDDIQIRQPDTILPQGINLDGNVVICLKI